VPGIEQVQFRSIRQGDLPAPLQIDITFADGRSLIHDFPNVPTESIDQLAVDFHDMRQNPNRFVGSAHYFPHQRFGKMKHIVARRNDRLLAHVAVSHNSSSSSTPQLPPALAAVRDPLEIALKLYTPIGLWTSSRYLYAGFCAITEEGRDMVSGTPEGEINVIEGLLLAGAQKRNPHLPFRTYPYAQEALWRQTLENNGVAHLANLDPGERTIFGEQGPQVSVLAYGVDHLYQLTDQLRVKEGADLVLRNTVVR